MTTSFVLAGHSHPSFVIAGNSQNDEFLFLCGKGQSGCVCLANDEYNEVSFELANDIHVMFVLALHTYEGQWLMGIRFDQSVIARSPLLRY